MSSFPKKKTRDSNLLSLSTSFIAQTFSRDIFGSFFPWFRNRNIVFVQEWKHSVPAVRTFASWLSLWLSLVRTYWLFASLCSWSPPVTIPTQVSSMADGAALWLKYYTHKGGDVSDQAIQNTAAPCKIKCLAWRNHYWNSYRIMNTSWWAVHLAFHLWLGLLSDWERRRGRRKTGIWSCPPIKLWSLDRSIESHGKRMAFIQKQWAMESVSIYKRSFLQCLRDGLVINCGQLIWVVEHSSLCHIMCTSNRTRVISSEDRSKIFVQ